MIKTPIYLDHHATTPVDPRVLEAMLPYFSTEFGNPSSKDHTIGASANAAIESARQHIAQSLHARPNEIIFTSGATEANNLALQGVAYANRTKGKHLITCVTEHKAVLSTCHFLEQQGWKVTYLPVNSEGVIDLSELENAITDQTVLISIMSANNEIGVIAPIKEIGEIAHNHGVFFHTDATQAIGITPIDVETQNIDLLSLSGHKIYGPKGIGALYLRKVNPRVPITPIMYGGGQENAIRPGTLNTPGIIGLSKALQIAVKEMPIHIPQLTKLRNSLYDSLREEIPVLELNGALQPRLPHNLNIFFPNIEAKALIQLVSDKLALSAGSACTTKEVEPSHVIIALGHSPQRAYSSIRIGLGRSTTLEEIEYTIKELTQAVIRLKKISGI